MSAIKAGNNIDLGKNEIQNAVIQNLAADPGSPVKGLIYFNTVTNKKRTYNGTIWDEDGVSSGDVVGPSSSVDSEAVVFNSTTGKLIKRSALTGIIKQTSGVQSVATAGTDYTTPSSTESPTNKTFNAAGAGNSISNIATSMFAANVIDTDVTLAANSDTRIASQKAAKAYADAISQGIKWKEPVRAATTANGTLATAYENGDVIDGVTLATGDRILLKDQTAGAENGIYVVAASGAPARALDADNATEVANMVVDVREGTVNADQAYVMTNNGAIVIGTTALVFVDFVKASVPAATTAVAGKVTLASQAEAEAKSDANKAVVPADLVNFPIKKIFTIGNGSSTTLTCTHSLNTKDVIVQVRDASTDAVILVDIACNNVNSVDIIFSVAPASNAYKVVVIG